MGPNSKWVMYWPSHHKVAIDYTTQSTFITEMHNRDLAVHPYTLHDDSLVYMSTAWEETLLYITKGVDGLFTEFPGATYDQFAAIGTKSDFPAATAQTEDLQ